MKSKLSTRIIVFIILIGIIGSSSGVYQLNRNLEDMKIKFIHNNEEDYTRILDNYFNVQKKNVFKLVYDISKWDELSYAIKENNYDWIKNNATEYLYKDKNYEIDLVYLSDNGNYEEFYCDKDIKKDLLDSHTYKDMQDSQYITTGFEKIGNDLYIISAGPIIYNEKITGHYALGRKIDEEKLNQISHGVFGKNLNNIFIDTALDEESIKIKDNQVKMKYLFINNDGSPIYAMNIFYFIEEYSKMFRDMVPQIYKLTLIIGLVVLLGIIHYIRSINKIFTNIIEGIDNVAKGNYDFNMKKSNIVEFDKLINHTNAMSKLIQNKMNDLVEQHFDTMNVLNSVIEAKDPYTKGHSERVSKYSVLIGKEMGLKDINFLREAAMLHDIGKISIPESILLKNGALTSEEYEVIKGHSEAGYNILSNAKAFEKIKIPVREHHERYDGRGYPDGLATEDISIEARIIAVADTFDALTSDRAYRKGMNFEQAIEIIKENSGTQFDPKVVESFIKCIDPRGSISQK